MTFALRACGQMGSECQIHSTSRGSLRPRVQELRDGGHELCRRKRLFEQDAVGDAMRGPLIGSRPRHIDDGKSRVYFPDLPCQFPTVQFAIDVDVGHERSISDHSAPEHRERFVSRCRHGEIEARIAQGMPDQVLQDLLVFDEKNDRQFVQKRNPRPEIRDTASVLAPTRRNLAAFNRAGEADSTFATELAGRKFAKRMSNPRLPPESRSSAVANVGTCFEFLGNVQKVTQGGTAQAALPLPPQAPMERSGERYGP